MDEQMTARIRDMIRQYEKRDTLMVSPFLDLASAREAEAMAKRCRPVLLGGYEEAERRALFLLPYDMEAEEVDQSEYFAAIRIKTPREQLTHRDFLGSVLALGVKRERIGDILVSGEEALLVAEKKLAPYIADELIRVGRAAAHTEVIDLSELAPPEKKEKHITATVQTPRLDAVAAAAFQLSRSRMGALIDAGAVSLNWKQTLKRDAEVSEGDVISIRHMGRAKVESFGGRSRKDRQFLSLIRYE
ncbi:MAG: hypothetical protein IJP37_00415 [Clostridia bacterium]|nr:hypothetical protein [Clostridia bacterium]